MVSINDLLPKDLQEIVERRFKEMHFPSAQAYIESLIKRDEDGYIVPDNLEALLQEAVDSGSPIEVDADFWKRRAEQMRKYGKIEK